MTMHSQPHKKAQSGKRGFTLLFSVLVASLVVAIGATIISIAVRQTVLSGTSRESQYAFYATNTVLECAFYWDVIGIPLGSTGAAGSVFPAPGDSQASDLSSVTCAGGNIFTGAGFETPKAAVTNNSGGINRTTFYIQLKDSKNRYGITYCAQATVNKTKGADGVIRTTIEAKGYNTCDLTNPRAVERGLIQSYES